MPLGSRRTYRWAGLYACAAMTAAGGFAALLLYRPGAIPSAGPVFIAGGSALFLLRPGRDVAAARISRIIGLAFCALALAGLAKRGGTLPSQWYLQAPAQYFAIVLTSGAGFFLSDKHLIRDLWLGQIFFFFALGTTLLALMGHGIGFYPFYGESPANAMSAWTVFGFLALCIGFFLARPRRGLAGIVRAQGVAGVAARRLLPMPVVVPFVAGWLNLIGVGRHWYPAQLGGWLFSLANTVAFGGLVWWTVSLLRRIEDERERFRAAVQRSNAALESRVHERTAELTRLNLELRNKASQLAASNAELEQFAFVAAHDLQEPLRNTRAYSELVVRRYRDRLDADGQEFLGFIVAGASKMSKLVSDLLSYSQAVHIETALEPVALDAVLASAVENCGAALRETGAAVRYGGLPEVNGNKPKLIQLFQNLLSNGLKYRRPGVPPILEIEAISQGGLWRVAVRDNGIGIAPEYHEKVFGLFKRLHGPEYPGTGVGLALCRRIVQQHGGHIWVDPAPENGTTIFVTLASADQTAAPGAQAQSVATFE